MVSHSRVRPSNTTTKAFLWHQICINFHFCKNVCKTWCHLLWLPWSYCRRLRQFVLWWAYSWNSPGFLDHVGNTSKTYQVDVCMIVFVLHILGLSVWPIYVREEVFDLNPVAIRARKRSTLDSAALKEIGHISEKQQDFSQGFNVEECVIFVNFRHPSFERVHFALKGVLYFFVE